jgi:7-cyano-7-deazaguanine synthase in queuosine biosynthesis
MTETTGRVLLYSGGMDSEAMRLLWGPAHLLYVDLGTAYAPAERRRLRDGVTVLDLSALRWLERGDGILPARNLILSAIASSYGNVIGIGATLEDRVLDKSRRFADDTSALLTYLWSPQWWTPGKEVTVELPLKSLSKYDILARVAATGYDLEQLARQSFSCYAPLAGDHECGACKPCARKWLAFTAHGVPLTFSAEHYCRTTLLPAALAGTNGRPEEDRLLIEVLDGGR